MVKIGRYVEPSAEYAKTILDSLSAHVAIIDDKGVILETNKAWKAFAETNDIQIRPDTMNVNYLEICDAASGSDGETSKAVAAGIREVISGDIDEFAIDYPCHSPNEKRWFYMKALRSVGGGPLRIVISHENVTALKLAEERLRLRKTELREKTNAAEEANAALRAILRQRDQDKAAMEAAIIRNLDVAVFPHLLELKKMIQGDAASRRLVLMESGLKEIVSPFFMRLANVSSLLTPQEIQIAHLIRAGKTSKEISQLLNLSITTINFHRRNLRKKLGLQHSTTNIGAYLRALIE